MKISLAQRCVHHPTREAVARCPECGRFFCRECISEHEDRVLCARCLSRGLAAAGGKRSRFAQVARCFAALLSILIAWWFFDLVGRGLILMPSAVHEGSIWQKITDE